VSHVDDIRALLNAGADKVSIKYRGREQSGAHRTSGRTLRRTVHRAAIDAKAIAPGRWEVYNARRPDRDRPRRCPLGTRSGSGSARARSCSPAWTAMARAAVSILGSPARSRTQSTCR